MLATVSHPAVLELEDDAIADIQVLAVSVRRAALEADHAAVDNHMAGKQQFSASHDERAYRDYRQRFAGGAGTYPLIGTPDEIAAVQEGVERVAEEKQPFEVAVIPHAEAVEFFRRK